MQVSDTFAAYFSAVKLDPALSSKQEIEKHIKENSQRFSYGNVNYAIYGNTYNSKGYILRKIVAIPAALWSGIVKVIYHLVKAIFCGMPKACLKDSIHIKADVYRIARDMEEALGWLVSLFNDKKGSYLIQESLFHKECYNYFEKAQKKTSSSISSPVVKDVCNLSHIYNSSYQYSLPQKVLEGFISGKAFDNKENYTEEESKNLRKDINELYTRIISPLPLLAKESIAIMTAGAPGAGKTTKLRQDLEAKAIQGKRYAYICPDDVCLQNQTRTYKAELEKSDNSMAARQSAYNKWRPGSNAATHIILGNLIREKYAFYFGTTSTGAATGKFFEFLKAQGYHIRLIHVSASDDVRWGSIQERDKTFVQTTEQDVQEKGLLLPQRINDTFLKYADEIEFYYRDAVKQDAILAAKWLRNKEHQDRLGTLQIIALEPYKRIKTIHNEGATAVNRPDLYWESTVEKVSQIF